MKTFSVSLVLAAGIAVSSTAFAQIPVTDGASIANSIQQQIETMAKWKMQYDQMVSQIDQMKQQYQSLTGSRGLGQQILRRHVDAFGHQGLSEHSADADRQDDGQSQRARQGRGAGPGGIGQRQGGVHGLRRSPERAACS